MEVTAGGAFPPLKKNGSRTILLAGPGVRAARAVLVWLVALVPSEGGYEGRHVRAATMTPSGGVKILTN